MPDWGFEVGVNSASWFATPVPKTHLIVHQNGRALSSPLNGNTGLSPQPAAAAAGPPRPELDRKFRASCLRYTLRLSFQLTLLALSSSALYLQLRSVRFLHAHGFRYCLPLSAGLIVALLALSSQIVVLVVSFWLYLRHQSITKLRHLAAFSSVTFLAYVIFGHVLFALSFLLATFLHRPDHVTSSDQVAAAQSRLRVAMAGDWHFSMGLLVTVLDCVMHWCQSWVVYLWRKPCCYFAEKFPTEELRMYEEAGLVKGVQIFVMPVVPVTVFVAGVLSLAIEPNLHVCHSWVLALWLATLITIPVIIASTLLPLYFVGRLIQRMFCHKQLLRARQRRRDRRLPGQLTQPIPAHNQLLPITNQFQQPIRNHNLQPTTSHPPIRNQSQHPVRGQNHHPITAQNQLPIRNENSVPLQRLVHTQSNGRITSPSRTFPLIDDAS